MKGFKLYRKIREQAATIRQLVVGVTRPVEMLDSTQNAGLVKVTLWFIDHHPDDPTRFSPSEYIVAVGEVDTFVAASLEVYTGGRTAPVQYITTQPLQPRGPYWWSGPARRNGDPAGAVIWGWGYAKRVWVRSGVKIDEDDPEYVS